MLNTFYAIAADIVLAIHVAVALFVVAGLLLIIIGNLTNWVQLQFVNQPWFRFTHITAVATVVAQAWLGIVCPLTTFEMWLREQAGETTYAGSFIAHWVAKLLYVQAPPWVFIALYSVFGLTVVAAWVLFPMRRKSNDQSAVIAN